MLDEDALWRRCENAWAQWLSDNDFAVTRLTDATHNTAHSGAPLMQIGDKLVRAPDLLATSASGTEYWEVKTRSRADVDQLTGQTQHWMDYQAFSHYLAVTKYATRVWVVLFETPTAVAPGRWLKIDVERLRDVGFHDDRRGVGGAMVKAWVWPVSEMEPTAGPVVEVPPGDVPLLPQEGAEQALTVADLAAVERTLRRRLPSPAPVAQPVEQPPETLAPDLVIADGPEVKLEHWLDSEPALALDVLRRTLEIPYQPRYSVLRVGLDGVDIDDLLGLLHYGIRLFLVSSSKPAVSMESTQLQAFVDSRMLEWAVVPEAMGCDAWIVDGQVPDETPATVIRAVQAADDAGEVNLAQYRVVHSPPGSDVVVRAGAGTGKTETMAERAVFLLATSSAQNTDAAVATDLRADEIALVTFTRESAAEMRQRIARTLLLRQRLCQRCALPALAWMLQLAAADIVTIHTLAKRVTASGAGALGLGPDFRVARRTLEFRAAVYQALSSRLETMIASHHTQVPAAYEWLNHVQAVWDALENNGVDLFRLGSEDLDVVVDWGAAPSTGLEKVVVETTRDVILEVAEAMKQLSLREQTLPTNQLVPSATAALRSQDEPLVRRYRYLFVDEFQDTDAAQIDLVLELRERLDCRLFVVGDIKQGIYRFRGAEGNAFEELFNRVKASDLPTMTDFTLTRNFRSGERLLDSLHPYFERWGRDDLLVYSSADQLRPRHREKDGSREIVIESVRTNDFATEAADRVARWRALHPGDSIGILCRQNWQAEKVQTEVQARSVSCELRVGGSFFESPAVREFRVLLEAVADPEDHAALLELCETRWAPPILAGTGPVGVDEDVWGADSELPVPWGVRLAAAAEGGSFQRDDLYALRLRLRALRSMLRDVPVLAWVVELTRVFEPEAYRVPDEDDAERVRYGRCLDHLITLVDAQFKDGATTLERLLFWVRLQIATNHREDEPDAETDGKVVALTVHKAKGLEFERVVLPTTGTRFGPPASVVTRTSVLRPNEERPRVLWKWDLGHGSGASTFSNVPLFRQADWSVDDRDTTREETRLLYVAMTRAREELLVFVDSRTRQTSNPTSWAELIEQVF